jgi:hypothetical protein
VAADTVHGKSENARPTAQNRQGARTRSPNPERENTNV